MAASMGLITTKLTNDVYGRVWRVTAKGLTTLEEYEGPELPEYIGQEHRYLSFGRK